METISILDAELLRRAFLAGASELETHKEWINELNVFPVPDGDTGTNMTLTILSAAKEVSAQTGSDLQALCKAISSGSLRGARGNSGVILSQLLRGLTKGLAIDAPIGVKELAGAFRYAAETAYKAVMKPKEGTILTVARAVSEKASKIAETETDLISFMEQVIAAGDEMLARTPEMLPVLKEAGVVDSGGQGLMVVLKGALKGAKGETAELSFDKPETAAAPAASRADLSNIETADIKFGYCTEFIVNLEKPFPESEELAFKEFLSSIGDSIVCVSLDDIVKVHVHTNDPGLALQKGLSYGSLSRMKIDNMREEHNERLIRNASEIAAKEKAETEAKKAEESKAPAAKYGFVSVAAGSGLCETFRGIGVDHIIEGGQTMNPSTEDFLTAIKNVNAETVFLLPNNKNIILAAEQAKLLSEDRNVYVIPTRNIPQGIAAMIGFLSDLSPEENLEGMSDAASAVRTAQITYAVRDTSIDGFAIHDGDIMAIGDSGMLTTGTDLNDTAFRAIEMMVDEDSSLVTLYFGEGVSEEDAEALRSRAEEAFPDIDIECSFGGQPVYYYFISVE